MHEISLRSYAKVNLSIDVGDRLSDGYHTVDMIMQQTQLHDDIKIGFEPGEGRNISVTTNRYYIPTDNRNLAVRAAELLTAELGDRVPQGRTVIDIFKRIPVAAGLAGGSGNGAAVLIGLNRLHNLGLGSSELCHIGKKLGSDVPFCIMGQLGEYTCARALGTGTLLEPVKPETFHMVLAKPPMGVSTREVYAGIDECTVNERPDNDRLAAALASGDRETAYSQMINVLECYTLRAYPQVAELKKFMENETDARKVLMSGSGPTVVALYRNGREAKDSCRKIRNRRYEAYWTKTMR